MMRHVLLLAAALAYSTGAAAQAGGAAGDLDTILKNPNAPPSAPPPAPPSDPLQCYGAGPGGMSLLGVQMQTSDGPSSGTRGMNPYHPANRAILAEAQAARDELKNVARQFAPDIYGLGQNVSSGAYVALGAGPDFIEIAIKNEPDSKLRDKSAAAERLANAERAARENPTTDSQSRLRFAQQEFDVANNAHALALRTLHELQRQQKAYEAATRPLAVRIALIEARANTMCKG